MLSCYDCRLLMDMFRATELASQTFMIISLALFVELDGKRNVSQLFLIVTSGSLANSENNCDAFACACA